MHAVPSWLAAASRWRSPRRCAPHLGAEAARLGADARATLTDILFYVPPRMPDGAECGLDSGRHVRRCRATTGWRATTRAGRLGRRRDGVALQMRLPDPTGEFVDR
jgi:hypothetical protein